MAHQRVPAHVRELPAHQRPDKRRLQPQYVSLALHRTLTGTEEHIAEFAFIAGVEGLGVLSIAAGFMTSKIPLIVFRALSGIGEYLATAYPSLFR